jgi:hypothetical protein
VQGEKICDVDEKGMGIKDSAWQAPDGMDLQEDGALVGGRVITLDDMPETRTPAGRHEWVFDAEGSRWQGNCRVGTGEKEDDYTAKERATSDKDTRESRVCRKGNTTRTE